MLSGTHNNGLEPAKAAPARPPRPSRLNPVLDRHHVNKSEAKTILGERLTRYRESPYEDLARLVGSCETEEITGPSGVVYQLEYQVVWDGKPGDDVRVMGCIDDGGIRAFLPLTDDFIKASDGRFVGE